MVVEGAVHSGVQGLGSTDVGAPPDRLATWAVVHGAPRCGAEVELGVVQGVALGRPRVTLDELVARRAQPGPAFDVTTAEIIEVLAATGEAVRRDDFGYLAESLSGLVATSSLDSSILSNAYEDLWRAFEPERAAFQVENELGGAHFLDGWHPRAGHDGRVTAVRAFPPRLVHVLAGNSPGLAASSLVRSALTKGVHLVKLPSNDLFTTPALLRTMARVAPDHPAVRSFTAVYWRGGDAEVESALFRPQFFDKLVAWGGEGTIRNAVQYVGPGFELVSFDPKNSISIVGREAFASDETLAEAAAAAAVDATLFNQDACVSSRFQFVEGSTEDADRFADALLPELALPRRSASVRASVVPAELRDEIDALRSMPTLFRVVGAYDGTGMVIRSDEPVDFHPSGKIVNVIPVESLADAVSFADVSTQTVGVYPAARKAEVRDALASAGVQRVVELGAAGQMPPGFPHDGFLPLHRLVRWVNDEEGTE